MKKSFKKALAAVLAVMMIVTAFPITAFAKPGDYAPNINMRFSSFSDGNGVGANRFVKKTNAAGADFSMTSLNDVFLDYDEAQGTLTMNAAKTQKADEVLELGALQEDYQYQVGDMFAVTFSMQNIQKLWVSEYYLTYSDNIEPAGYYSYKEGRKTVWNMGTVSEAAQKNGTFAVGGPKAVKFFSAEGIYKHTDGTTPAFNDSDKLGDMSLVTDEKNEIFVSNVECNGTNGVDVTTTTGEYFVDPNTGDASIPYVYNNECIMETFVFQITQPGPIKFDVEDKDNHRGAYSGIYYISDKTDGVDPTDFTTYAVQEGCPGSAKLTFMGRNDNLTPAPPACEHTNLTYTPNVDAPKTHKVVCADCQAVVTESEACTFTSEETRKPTCKVAGEKTYTCSKCAHSYTEEIPVVSHTPGTPQKENVNGATCTTPGSYDLVTRCTVCSEIITTTHKEGELAPHTPAQAVREKEVPATCTTKGSYEEVVYCQDCHTEISRSTKEIPMVAHTAGSPAEENRVEATCQAPGSYDLVTRCTVCNAVISTENKTIAQLEHQWAVDPSGVTKASTCTTAGFETHKCALCNETKQVALELDPQNHAGEGTKLVNQKDATIDAPGYTGDTACAGCNAVIENGKEIPMLASYIVDVVDEGLGTVSGLNFGQNKLAKDAAYTVTAQARSGASFLGWYNGEKLLTTDATYTSVATTNVTLTPKFAEEGTDKITVTFVDMWGNAVKQFDSMTVEAYQAAVAKEMPAASSIGGYLFDGWDLTDEQIKTISTSQTVRAKYTLKTDGFTITANGATFVSGTTDGINVKYDTLVTIKAEGAQAWKIGTTIVGYGDTYSFYVGSDVTVDPVFDHAEAKKPATTIVKVTPTDTAVVNFLATRTVPAGFELVNAGFVYGKTADEAALVIENAGKNVSGANIHVGYCRVGGAEQFLLPYGLRSQSGTIGARSFVTYKTADGAVETIYSDVASYTYA